MVIASFLGLSILDFHLRECLKILTIIVDFMENIWNLGVAMTQSENYLEHDVAQESCFSEKYLCKWKPLPLHFGDIYNLKVLSRN